jgi:prepilin-type N-terminal cleavage/methylation domain-containing protein
MHLVNRSRRTGRGFTLTELLIVLLIIAILMALILPRFFGARRNAGDKVAQQTLQVAARDAQAQATDLESYANATATDLAELEGDIDFVAGTAASTKSGNSRSVSVNVSGDGTEWTAASIGEGGACWWIRLDLGLDANNDPVPTQYGFGEVAAASCRGNNLAAATDINGDADNESKGFPQR